MENLRIALPISEGKLSPHFGHCTVFVMFDVKEGAVVAQQELPAPPHQPGMLPSWLHENGANVLIAGGIGGRAKTLLAQSGIQVVDGVAPDDAETVVKAYLTNTLSRGESLCDH